MYYWHYLIYDDAMLKIRSKRALLQNSRQHFVRIDTNLFVIIIIFLNFVFIFFFVSYPWWKMNEKDCEEMVFNPFYIGPHPSKACTTTNNAANTTENTAHQCSPESPDSKSSSEQQDNSQLGVTQTAAGNAKEAPAAAAESVACPSYPCNDVRK